MKTRLKPEDRALFDAAREGLAPTDHDRVRVAKALGLNLGVGAGITTATAKAVAGSAAALPASAGVSAGIVGAKWVAIVAVVVSVSAGAGGVALYRAETAPAHSPPAAVSAGAGSAREPSTPRVPGTLRTPVVGEAQPHTVAAPPTSLPSGLAGSYDGVDEARGHVCGAAPVEPERVRGDTSPARSLWLRAKHRPNRATRPRQPRLRNRPRPTGRWLGP